MYEAMVLGSTHGDTVLGSLLAGGDAALAVCFKERLAYIYLTCLQKLLERLLKDIPESFSAHSEESYEYIAYPLATAVQNNSIGMVKLLLQHGAKPDMKSTLATPLDIAKQGNKKEILTLLEAAQAKQQKAPKGGTFLID